VTQVAILQMTEFSRTLERGYRLLLESRERKGIESYGETLDTSKVDVQQYLIEELADAVLYAARIIGDLERHRVEMETKLIAVEKLLDESPWYNDTTVEASRLLKDFRRQK